MTRERIITAAELPQLLTKWQKLMRLDNWQLEAEIVSMRSLDGAEANIETDTHMKQGLIRLGNMDGYSHFMAKPLDMEFNLVHELLHIYFNEVLPDGERDDKEKQRLEFAINAIAGAMIGLGQPVPEHKRPPVIKRRPMITLSDPTSSDTFDICVDDIVNVKADDELSCSYITLKNGYGTTVREMPQTIERMIQDAKTGKYRGC